MKKNMDTKLREQGMLELMGIACPKCKGFERLSISVDGRSVYCAECGDTIGADYLAKQGFRLDQLLTS